LQQVTKAATINRQQKSNLAAKKVTSDKKATIKRYWKKHQQCDKAATINRWRPRKQQ